MNTDSSLQRREGNGALPRKIVPSKSVRHTLTPSEMPRLLGLNVPVVLSEDRDDA